MNNWLDLISKETEEKTNDYMVARVAMTVLKSNITQFENIDIKTSEIKNGSLNIELENKQKFKIAISVEEL